MGVSSSVSPWLFAWGGGGIRLVRIESALKRLGALLESVEAGAFGVSLLCFLKASGLATLSGVPFEVSIIPGFMDTNCWHEGQRISLPRYFCLTRRI